VEEEDGVEDIMRMPWMWCMAAAATSIERCDTARPARSFPPRHLLFLGMETGTHRVIFGPLRFRSFVKRAAIGNRADKVRVLQWKIQ